MGIKKCHGEGHQGKRRREAGVLPMINTTTFSTPKHSHTNKIERTKTHIKENKIKHTQEHIKRSKTHRQNQNQTNTPIDTYISKIELTETHTDKIEHKTHTQKKRHKHAAKFFLACFIN